MAPANPNLGTDATPWAVITGWYVNAYSIVHSLRAIGWQGRTVCLRQARTGAVLADQFGRDVEVWTVDLDKPSDLPDLIMERIPADAEAHVFCTDERFLGAFRQAAQSPQPGKPRILGTLPAATRLDTILDRFAFYEFIRTRNLAPVPQTLPAEPAAAQSLGTDMAVRVKRSWDGLRKLPRVHLVRSEAERQQVEAALQEAGMEPHEWCYQERLSTCPEHNVSVCGWHDAQEQRYWVTRKVVQHPPEIGNGDVCELLTADFPQLQEWTRTILEGLEFQGAFEMEFVLDRNTGGYKVIELNPRFWMQHGLIEEASNHLLVRRHLGMPAADPPASLPRYWINPVYGLKRLLRADFRSLRYAAAGPSMLVPPLGMTLRWIPRYMARGFGRTDGQAHP